VHRKRIGISIKNICKCIVFIPLERIFKKIYKNKPLRNIKTKNILKGNVILNIVLILIKVRIPIDLANQRQFTL